jgi:hypothetical protein
VFVFIIYLTTKNIHIMAKKFTIENGMLLREVFAQLKPHQVSHKTDFHQKVRGYEIPEHRIFIPRELRAPGSKLDKATLGSMAVRQSEDDASIWFLEASQRVDSFDGY